MIRLVVTDIDGTLVTKDKRLTDAALAAAASLADAGVALALVSSRPPQGVAVFADALGLATPRGAFNGAMIVDAGGNVLESLLLPAAAARESILHLEAAGISPWLFTADEWLLRNPAGDYVEWEHFTVKMPWRVVPDFAPYLGEIGKLMAASKDFAKLAACEAALQGLLAGHASAHRSQDYYLDITHTGATKGHALAAIAARLGITPAETACLGDMPNDLPMFDVAGFAIAMGNAPPEVQARADAVTGSNEADGWARAVTELILPRCREAA